MEIENTEIVIRKNRGNHRTNYLNPFDWVGGMLFLTNHRLIFKPNLLNFKANDESIPLENILSIKAKHHDFISSKLSIFLIDGCMHEFHVPNRKDWVQDIEKAIKDFKNIDGVKYDFNEKLSYTIPKKSLGWYLKLVVQAILLAFCVSIITFIFLNLLK